MSDHELFSTLVIVLDRPGIDDSLWTFFLTETDGTIAVDPHASFPTPGAALDAGIQWCSDRGLIMKLNGKAFAVFRNMREAEG